MEVQDDELEVKTEPDVKRQYINNAVPREKNEGSIQEEDANYVDLSSDEEEGSRDDRFKKERDDISQKNVRVVDLNKETFSGIVKLCRNENLIDEELAHCFFTKYRTNLAFTYIECYRTNQLHRFNFAQSKINIIDHRRLVEMLLDHDKELYVPIQAEGPYDYLRVARDFLKDIYSIPLEEYQKMLKAQVNMYYQSWWGGPQNLNPAPIDPFVSLVNHEETQRLIEVRQKEVRNQKIEEERQRLKRIDDRQATKNDLMQIAKQLSTQLFGSHLKQQKEKEIKFQDQQASESRGESSVSSKQKKRKGEKKQKKEKDKKKSKKKKAKKDDEIKREQLEGIQAKVEAMQEQATNYLPGSKKTKKN